MTTTVTIFAREADPADSNNIIEREISQHVLDRELGEGGDTISIANGAIYRDSFVHEGNIFFFSAENYPTHAEGKVTNPPGYEKDPQNPAYQVLIDGKPPFEPPRLAKPKCEEKAGLYNDQRRFEVITAVRRYEVRWKPRKSKEQAA